MPSFRAAAMLKLVISLSIAVCVVCADRWSSDYPRFQDKTSAERATKRFWKNRLNAVEPRRPNIVFILTDDQDLLLGSMDHMPRTRALIKDLGATFNNSFVTTPMCCPSRSSILTGLYPHNHNVYSNNDNCSSPQWQMTHEPHIFSNYLQREGYRTGYFGKYLNEYNGSYIPPGWTEWVGLIKNSRFYNYTLNFNGKRVRHYDDYYSDYLTDLIANDSVTFLQKSKQYFSQRPVLMVLSVPAPHGPEDSAPQYQNMFFNNSDHRTQSWDFAPNNDKQWLLRYTYPMEPIHKHFTDVLQQKRLQTLQSVDDLVEKVISQLDILGELENTYIIFTSDHGYHLGQFGLVKGKAMPYDFDTKVPMYIRGPGITPGTMVSNIVSNIDLAPTILDMAGVTIPERMDGESMLTLLRAGVHTENVDPQNFISTKIPWRDTILLERGKLTQKKWQRLMKLENEQLTSDLNPDALPYLHSRQRRIVKICSKPENHLPCTQERKFLCKTDGGRTRLQKCTNQNYLNTLLQGDQPYTPYPWQPKNKLYPSHLTLPKNKCICEPFPRMQADDRRLYAHEKRKQKQFLKMHVNKDFKAKFIKQNKKKQQKLLKRKRKLLGSIRKVRSTFQSHNPSYLDMINSDSGITDQSTTHLQPSQLDSIGVRERRCRFLPNNTISCDTEIYVNADAWKDQKVQIDGMIKEYRKMLEDLRVIRKHLKEQKPADDYDFNSISIYKDDIDLSKVDDEFCDCPEDNINKTQVLRKEDNAYETPLAVFPGHKITGVHKKRNKKKWKKKWKKKKNKRRKSFTKECNAPFMKCFSHDNDHWKTPPLWKDGSFCFCPNSNNNTYWCLRTVNQTHDFLYCEFVTNFISYYNLRTDPFQLKNVVTELNYGILQQLHDKLSLLRSCQGKLNCNLRYQALISTKTKKRLKRGKKWRKRIRLRRRLKHQQKVQRNMERKHHSS